MYVFQRKKFGAHLGRVGADLRLQKIILKPVCSPKVAWQRDRGWIADAIIIITIIITIIIKLVLTVLSLSSLSTLASETPLTALPKVNSPTPAAFVGRHTYTVCSECHDRYISLSLLMLATSAELSLQSLELS